MNVDINIDEEKNSNEFRQCIEYNDLLDIIISNNEKLFFIYFNIYKNEKNLFIENGKNYMLKFALNQSIPNILILDYLLKNGANPNYIDGFDYPLKIIISQHPSRYDIIDLLLYYGANINFTNSIGNSALMYACFSNNHNMISYLMDNGADPYITNQQGESAISICHRQNKKIEKKNIVKKK
jgi:ankyrin repeat protein